MNTMYKTRKKLTSRPLCIHDDTEPVTRKSIVDEEGCTALMTACKEGNPLAVKDALQQDDINCQDEDGWTALMYAAYGNHPEIVVMLLESNANIHLKTVNGKNVRWLAYTEGHELVVSILDEYLRTKR